MAGFSYLQIGADTIDTFYIGDLQIEALYMGEEQIYGSGPFVGLKATNTLSFNPNQLTGTLKIKSSENWSLTDNSGGGSYYTLDNYTTGCNGWVPTYDGSLDGGELGEYGLWFEWEYGVSDKSFQEWVDGLAAYGITATGSYCPGARYSLYLNPHATGGPGWLSYSQTTGGTGETIVTVTASTAQAARTAIITISSANFTATTDVIYNFVELVDYVFVNYGGNIWNSTVRLDTGIVHTASTMSFRIKYKNTPTFTGSGQYSDRVMGYSYQFNNEATGSAITRFFGYNGWSVDYGNGSNRLQGLGLTQANKIYDITWGDFYAYDNDTQSYIKTGTTKSIIGDNTAHIYVDLSFPICEVEIKDGNNVLFNGHAAFKNGVYGIWDSVSNQLLTAVNQSNVMTGGYFNN